jgi:hypothetical protein
MNEGIYNSCFGESQRFIGELWITMDFPDSGAVPDLKIRDRECGKKCFV